MQNTPDIKLHLNWDGELRFSGAIDDTIVHVDGSSEIAPSPVQMLSAALAGCMAIDIVDIPVSYTHLTLPTIYSV